MIGAANGVIGQPTTPRQIHELVGVHLATVYRWLKGASHPSRLARAKLQAVGVRGPWDFDEPRPRPRPKPRPKRRR